MAFRAQTTWKQRTTQKKTGRATNMLNYYAKLLSAGSRKQVVYGVHVPSTGSIRFSLLLDAVHRTVVGVRTQVVNKRYTYLVDLPTEKEQKKVRMCQWKIGDSTPLSAIL